LLIKNIVRKYIGRARLFNDLLSEIDKQSVAEVQRGSDYLEWINSNLVECVEEFTRQNDLFSSSFILKMGETYKTSKFSIFFKKWLVDYLFKLFNLLNDLSSHKVDSTKELILEDAPINRFAINKYLDKFGVCIRIKWVPPSNLFKKNSVIFFQILMVLFICLNKGIVFFKKKKRYKVMREAIWGLHDIGGYYFHDDFMVDGKKINKKDLLLFSRNSIAFEEGRSKACYQAKNSSYGHFYLPDLSIGLRAFFLRILPLYVVRIPMLLLHEVRSVNFSLFSSVYRYFFSCSIPYEKIFSHYKIISELGHNYFMASHVAEAIICENYQVKYYFLHWADTSIYIDKYISSFLGCDKFLLWGRAHAQGVEGDTQMLELIGYPFKHFIKNIISNREKIMSEMGIKTDGPVIVFFDETFGRDCKMTAEIYVDYWETILKIGQAEKKCAIVVKPKSLASGSNLPEALKLRYRKIKDEMQKQNNIFILNPLKWSFIEAIGIANVVITQGMTSSATIAIICGIDGLYFNQAHYNHRFAQLFEEKIVFDDPEKLMLMLSRILSGIERPLKDIPEELLREYDAYPDDLGLERLQAILLGEEVSG